VSVGGTSLTLSGKNYQSEAAWSGGVGGVSSIENEPAYQTVYGLTNSSNHRATPDVSYVADPNTGVAVYFSPAHGQGSWYVFGGTSVGAPQWAGLIVLANQGRTNPLSNGELTNSPVYTAATGLVYSANYHDITTGSSGANSAATGYDLATGVGSPKADALVPYLIGL
jgi:subtilase family serine protease